MTNTNMPRKRKLTFAMIGAGGFALCAVAVAIGLLFNPAKAPDADREATSARTANPTPAPEENERVPSDQAAVKTKLGPDGYVQMRATSDPKEAAAAAAAVLMSVDAGKVEYAEDFRVETLRRVMHPAPDYVGAGAQFLVEDPSSGETLDAAEYAERAPMLISSMRYSPAGWWWRLGDEAEFPSLTVRDATVVSEAIEVYDVEDIQELANGSAWTKFSDGITVDVTKPGASLGLYWVRVETTISAGDETAQLRNPVALAIYCDPPEESGVCGVVSLMTGYPSSWQRQ